MSDLIEQNVLNFIGGVSAMYFANALSNLKWSFLPPQLTRFLKKDLIIRQVFLFFLVFVSIQLTKGGSEIPVIDKAISSVFLYIFLLIFPKQTLEFALAESFLFLILYGIYYTLKNYDDISGENEDKLKITMYSFGCFLVLLILIGNILYYFKQKRDRGEEFNYIEFFFGDPKGNQAIPVIQTQYKKRRKTTKRR